MEQYLINARELHEKLLALISETIGLEPDALRKASEGSFGPVRSAARMNYYQPWGSEDEPTKERSLASHTDAGTVLTMLYSDEVAGLQIKKDGRWVKIEPITDAFIVNLGDQMEIMTNGRYKSVEHRGLPDKTRERLSLAAAYYPHKESVIGPIPELINDSNPQLYKVCNFSDYVTTFYKEGLNERHQTTYAKIEPR
ncbi:hypothetical protein Mapa_017767 [Marchantia paleacea]|nr:hypothetical protein Mapa_017767 [Marchantia paleacea]